MAIQNLMKPKIEPICGSLCELWDLLQILQITQKLGNPRKLHKKGQNSHNEITVTYYKNEFDPKRPSYLKGEHGERRRRRQNLFDLLAISFKYIIINRWIFTKLKKSFFHCHCQPMIWRT